jgi:RNA polymerase sigma-70 factor (ECF subfamily)
MADEEASFQELIHRVRARDEQAAADLVKRYERAIRVAVRVRLGGADLRGLLDSMDICQSVLASFFVRAALGQYELDTPQQLLRLLTAMARHKLLNQARKQRTARRDAGREERDPEAVNAVVDHAPDPSQIVADRELVDRLYARLPEDARWLADQRAQGRGWDDLAAEAGSSPDALRMRLKRTLNEAAEDLGL